MLASALTLVLLLLAAAHWSSYLLFFFESRRGGRSTPFKPPIAAASAWLGEYAAGVLALALWPLGKLRASTLPAQGPQRPVLLLHDWALNGASMAALAARLRADGRGTLAPTHAVATLESQDQAQAQLNGLLEQLTALAGTGPDGKVDVLTHGTGGLVLRQLLAEAPAAAQIGNMVTLGCPHRGTSIAYVLGGREAQRLRPGSRFLAELNEHSPSDHGGHYAVVYSTFDALTFPADNAHVDAAMNIRVDLVGHYSMLFSSRVYALARENLDFRQAGDEISS